MDLVPHTDGRWFGRPGAVAGRYSNLVVQASTHLLVAGARLDYPTTGFRPNEFAPHAERVDHFPDEDCDEWFAQCRAWKNQYPLPPTWVDEVSVYCQEGDIIVPSSSGMASEMFCQSFKVKENQRIVFSPGLGAMGCALPHAIGCAMAEPTRRVVCIEGDGSLMVNVQCLQTIRQHKLNIRLFILNNGGYASIRNTHKRHFDGRLLGCDALSGLTFPSIQHLAWTYGVEMHEIFISPDTQIRPRLQSRLVDGKVIPGRLEDVE